MGIEAARAAHRQLVDDLLAQAGDDVSSPGVTYTGTTVSSPSWGGGGSPIIQKGQYKSSGVEERFGRVMEKLESITTPKKTSGRTYTATDRYDKVLEDLRQAAMEVPGGVILDSVTGAAVENYTEHKHTIIVAASTTSVQLAPLKATPLQVRAESRCIAHKKPQADWAQRSVLYEQQAVERQKRSLARLELRTTRATRCAPPIKSPPPPTAQLPLPSEVLRDAPPSSVETPSLPPRPTPPAMTFEDFLIAEEKDREAILTKESVKFKAMVDEHDPAEILQLAHNLSRKRSWLAQLEEEKAVEVAREQRDKARRDTWEVVREVVWEEATVRGFVQSDEVEEWDGVRNIAEFWCGGGGLVEEGEREGRVGIQEEEIVGLHVLQNTVSVDKEPFARDEIIRREEQKWAELKRTEENELPYVNLSLHEAMQRAKTTRQEAITRTMLLSEAGTSLLRLVDKLQWLANCMEVDERFHIETEQAAVFKEVTYNHPVSYSVVRWVMKTMAEISERDRTELQNAGCSERSRIDSLEDQHRETIYELRSHSHAMLHRDAQNRKRSEIATAIKLAKETEQKLAAAGVPADVGAEEAAKLTVAKPAPKRNVKKATTARLRKGKK